MSWSHYPLKQQIIPRQEIAIFSLCQLSNQALNQALENTLSESHIRIKISLISNSRWIAAAIYGEALIYQRMSQEIMGLSLHRFSPS
ncbi:HutP family protein [Escherichia fergusonii]|uniref:HutP family protein n=1 Tax=Escherichia fergusonii TaxID=564 RepID=UPI0028FCE89C|nr:HutP family protein [Escherichia fergusonii]